MEKIPLNFGLMKEPENWFFIFLMVAIPLLGLSLIFHKSPTE